MMTNEDALSVISLVISCAILIAIYVAWRDYREDLIRDRFFEVRDRMFLYAFDNGLLENPAYKNTRHLMNGLIRFAHHLSFCRLVGLFVGRLLARESFVVPKEMSDWKVAVELLPKAQRDEILRFHHEALHLALRHVVFGSVTLFSSLSAIAIYFAIERRTRSVKQLASQELQGRFPPLGLIEAEAYRAA